MKLKDRILDCLPAGRYAFSALLRLLDVAETDAISTAAVECRAQPRMLVNPAFVQRHADTPEKLMMLVTLTLPSKTGLEGDKPICRSTADHIRLIQATDLACSTSLCRAA